MQHETVDIIIPTYQPDIKFDRLIQGLLQQTYPIKQIIIMHTKGSVFPTQVATFDQRIVVHEVEKEAFDHGGTRRAAVTLSKADFFVCMTQDAVPANAKMLEHLMEAFVDEEIACAYARQIPNKDCGVIETYTRSFNYPKKSAVRTDADIQQLGIKAFFCSNVCAAYRRSSYDTQGGFVKRAIFNEDMIMAATFLKAGYKCAYQAEAQVVHSHNYSAMQQLKRNFDLAVSQAEHPEIFAAIKSESEGIRLVKKTAKYLIQQRKPWLLVPLVWKSGFKYMGYKLGQHFRKLPKKVVIGLSSNPQYWYLNTNHGTKEH